MITVRRYLIDNQSIYNVKIKSLKNKISLVSQDTTLFDDTIKNNIDYAKYNASDEDNYQQQNILMLMNL